MKISLSKLLIMSCFNGPLHPNWKKVPLFLTCPQWYQSQAHSFCSIHRRFEIFTAVRLIQYSTEVASKSPVHHQTVSSEFLEFFQGLTEQDTDESSGQQQKMSNCDRKYLRRARRQRYESLRIKMSVEK